MQNSTKNIIFGIVAQVANVLLGLGVRTVFIHYLNIEYLGVNGVFSNILTMLSLAELGVGNAIVYHMYKPIAADDQVTIAKLMNLYKKAYLVIGIVVGVAGLALTPFLQFIVKEQPDIDHLQFIYLLFLSNTVLSYFFAYKRSIFSADQKERVLHSFKLVFYILRAVVQIVILVLFRSFILYLVVQIASTFWENLAVSFYADKKYPFLKQYGGEKLEKAERSLVFRDVRALFIYKIGSTVLDGTDSLIISATDGVVSVGLLSNYGLVSGSVQMLLSLVSGSITGSVGNFVAKKSKEDSEVLFKRISFLFFVLYGAAFAGLVGILGPFVKWWVGSEYMLANEIVLVHCINIYIFGMMSPVWVFRSTMGLFRYGKWRPLVSAVINLVVSIWWAKQIGLIGVLLGTTFTRVVTNVWFDPYIVYSKGFQKSPLRYLLKWCLYLGVVLAVAAASFFLQGILPVSGLLGVIVNGLVALSIFSVLLLLLFFRTDEFKYLLELIKRFTKRKAAVEEE